MREIDFRTSYFGHVRVLERLIDGARLYCVGDKIQTKVDCDGTSLCGYIHASHLLMQSCSKVLMIGGAGGSLATLLARCGVDVVVVDIDPVAEDLARRHFYLPPNVKWLNGDGLDYIRNAGAFDGIMIDACDAEGAVMSFATAHLLCNALLDRSTPASIVVNLGGEGKPRTEVWRLARDIARRGFASTLYRPKLGDETNELLHITGAKRSAALSVGSLANCPVETWPYLRSLVAYQPDVTGPAGGAASP